MPEISRIKMPSGSIYDIKDKYARELAEGGVHWRGVTTTPLVDGSTTNPITINEESYTASSGDMVGYYNATLERQLEFIWSGTYWDEISVGQFGALAFKDDAQGTVVVPSTFATTLTTEATDVTPAGTVSTPTVTVTPATDTIAEATSKTVAISLATAAPSATAPANVQTICDVDGETLRIYQLGYVTGDSITTEDKTVVTGITSATATQPTFTGTARSVNIPTSAATVTDTTETKTVTVS